jgi:hypothetical protein
MTRFEIKPIVMKRILVLHLILTLFTISPSKSQQVAWEKWFWPNPGLPRNAQSPLYQDSLSLRPFENKQALPVSPRINQRLSAQYQLPTDSIDAESSTLSLEFWLLQHINQPIGFEIFLGKTSLLGHWNEKWHLKTQEVPQ